MFRLSLIARTGSLVKVRFPVVVTIAVMGLVAATAAGSSLSSPIAVSDTSASPLAACTADAPASQPGRNFPNSEVEPYLAVNPTNPQNVVAVWQQDRWSNGGSRGNVVGTSFDGGATWTLVTATKSSLCTGGTAANGGDLPRASDPWLSFAPNGDLYLTSLIVRDEVISNAGDFGAVEGGMLVAKSTDGGVTWSDPVTMIREGCGALNDKEAITADPNDARFAYAAWTRYAYPNANAHASCLGALNAAISVDDADAASFVAPGWFARTTDGGQSWEPAREIFPVGQGIHTIDHQIVVLRAGVAFAGELVDFFVLTHLRTNAHKERGQELALIRSHDKGLTWSGELVVDRIEPIATTDPLTRRAIRAGVNPDAAADPRTGALYAVWKDGRFGRGAYGETAFTMSLDGGTTWTAPVKVNLTPATPQLGNRQAFLPSVAVGADGSVAVSYYDLRFNGTDASADETLETDHFLARCETPSISESDRCVGDWVETRITPASFNLRAAPNAGGLFLGDYMGLAAVGSGFGALFTQANGSADRASVYFATGP
jgi:hypothetical protein